MAIDFFGKGKQHPWLMLGLAVLLAVAVFAPSSSFAVVGCAPSDPTCNPPPPPPKPAVISISSLTAAVSGTTLSVAASGNTGCAIPCTAGGNIVVGFDISDSSGKVYYTSPDQYFPGPATTWSYSGTADLSPLKLGNRVFIVTFYALSGATSLPADRSTVLKSQTTFVYGTPSNLAQFRQDHTTPILDGGSTGGDSSIFLDITLPPDSKELVHLFKACDPLSSSLSVVDQTDQTTYALTGYEIKPLSTPFDGAGLITLGNSTTNSYSLNYGVSSLNGSYHWQVLYTQTRTTTNGQCDGTIITDTTTTNEVAGPPLSFVVPAGGTIQVASKNAITAAAIPSSWNIFGPANLTGTNESAHTYSGEPTRIYNMTPVPGSAGPLYAFSRLEQDIAVAPAPHPQSFLAALWERIIKVARAVVVGDANCQLPLPPGPCNSAPAQTLTSGGSITFNLVWDPVAALAVSSNSVSLTAQQGGADPSGIVAVQNNGAPGSTLNWTAAANQSWLAASPSGCVIAPPASSACAANSQNATITAKLAGLAPGTYTGTVTFSGTSLPNNSANPLDCRHYNPALCDKTVTVTLTVTAVPTSSLTVVPAGSGTGLVTSAPAGINCGANCSANFANGTSITLTATPAAGSTFAGWSAGTGSASSCSGTGTCSLVLNTNSSITATFTASGAFTLNSPVQTCSGTTPQLDLTWSAAAGATDYQIYRNGVFLRDVGNALAATDAGLTSGTSYTYFIRATAAGGTIDSNSRTATAPYCVGDITVNATLNASPWTGAIDYTLAGPGGPVAGSTVANTFGSLQVGTWILSYNSGGPLGGSVSSISPSNSQTLPTQSSRPSLTYTINFNAPAPDFSLSATPASRSIDPTNSTTFTVQAICAASFAGPVNNLKLTNLQANATFSFSSPTISCGGSTTLTINTTVATQTGTRTLTISGDGAGIGTRSDTVSLTVNSLNAPSARVPTNATCERITVTWNDTSDNEQGFHIWRNTTGGNSLASYTLIHTSPANATSYQDDPPVIGQTYYYIVTSYYAGSLDSSVDPSWPVSATNRQCVADLTPSQKIIYRVKGSPYSGQTIANGDTVTFRIIIDNSRGDIPAYDVYITDTLTNNLQYVPGSARLSGSGGSLSGETVSGQTITWDANRNLGDKAASNSNWIVTFDAVVNSTSQQSIDFFQNTAVIHYAQSNNGPQTLFVTVKSPLTPIRLAKTQVPNIKEIAP